jgi:YtkA-like protein
LLFSLVICTASAACSRSAETTLTELQRQREGAVDVVLLSARNGLRHGGDTFMVEFRSVSSGTLVDVGTVRGSANMPMAGMPMPGMIDVARTDVAGRYQATGDLSMAGTWRLTIDWEGPAGRGSVTFPASVQ